MGIMSKYGVNVPRGEIAITPEQARREAEKFGEYLGSKVTFAPEIHFL